MSLKKDVIGAEVQIGTNQAQASLTKLAQETSSLANENDRLRISQAKLKALGKESAEEYKKVTAAIADNSKTIKTNQAQMDALRKTIGLSDMSMKQLKTQAQNLRREIFNMNESADPARWAQLNTQLAATESQISTVRGTIGSTTSFMGKLGSSLSSIPGPVGSVIQSIGGMGKSLWALVANPIGATIAAIVGGLMLLYKAFTSTDTGAVAMEGTLKAIGNVMDILIDRAMSYYKMLWSLVTFDWEGVKKNAKDAFEGAGEALVGAAKAGTEYASVMDDIGDREAAAQIRMSKLRDEIEKLKTASKDVNKTAKEKSDLIDQAMAKSIELNGIEKGFMKERTAGETSNLAAKINNSKLTMAQKEAQLKQWLDIDDKQLASAKEKDAAFAKFMDDNEAEFQAMQKMKADEFQKDADFTTETRRLEKSAFTEKKAMRDEEIQARKAAGDKALEDLDAFHNKRMSDLVNQYTNEGMTDADFKAAQDKLEVDFLILKQQRLQEHGQSTVDIDKQINDKRIQSQKEFNDAMDEAEKETQKKQDPLSSDEAGIDPASMVTPEDLEFASRKHSLDEWVDYLTKKTKEQFDIKTKALEDEKAIQLAREGLQDAQIGGIEQLAGAMAGMFEEGSAAQIAFFALEKSMAIAQVWINYARESSAIAAAGAMMGPAGIAWEAVMQPKALIGAVINTALITAQAVAQVVGSKNGKKDGGFSNTGSDSDPDGIYHKNEFIASAPAVRNPTVKPILDIIDMAQRSGTISSLNLSALVSGARQSGGYAQQVSSSSGSSSSSSPVIIPGNESGMSEAHLAKLTAILDRLDSKDFSIAIETYERKRKSWEKVTSGGLK